MLSGLLLLTLAAPPDALAGGDGPPRTFLASHAKTQRGELGSYCWTYDSENGGVTVCADGVWHFPESFRRIPAGSHARIRLIRHERPDRLELVAYRELDENGFPADDGERLPVHLRRIVRDGKPGGWKARFRTPNEPGDLYLDLFAIWEPGDASYTFHLKLT